MPDIDLKSVLATLSEFGSSLDKANDSAHTTKGVGDDVTQPSLRKVLSPSDRMYMQREFSKLNESELTTLFSLQLKKDAGIPIQQAWDYQTMSAVANDPILSRALDTSGGAALQRQDLEPILYSIFIKNFPAFDRMRKFPANGVVHTWNQITSYGDAQFMSELGTVTDDTAVYARQTTNIAQLGTRRGVTFKEQLAVPAGGMSWNPAQIEIAQGLTAMAHKLQKTIFQGNASQTGGLSTNEYGAYDANGFTGLRSILNTASTATNFSPYLTSNPDSFVSAINSNIVNITDALGIPPNIVYMRAAEHAQFVDSQATLQRYVDRTEITPGVMVPSVATSVGILPVVSVPGDSIGTYTVSGISANPGDLTGDTVADIYVLNDNLMGLPYLGSPGPSIIEIPPGVSGQLTRLYIVWALMGFAVEVLPASGKIRTNQATS